MCLILGRWFGGGTRIISKSRNLYGFGKLVGGRGIGNHCKILASAWFWNVGWSAGHQKSLLNQSICMDLGSRVGGLGHQKSLWNQCICIVLEGLSWGRGTKNHLQNQCICIVLKRLAAGLVAPESLQNQYR